MNSPVEPDPPTESTQLIGAEGTEGPGEQRRSGEPRQRNLDEALDAALACTFPASDPVGCLTPHVGCSSPK
jgi:hypothetical protein